MYRKYKLLGAGLLALSFSGQSAVLAPMNSNRELDQLERRQTQMNIEQEKKREADVLNAGKSTEQLPDSFAKAGSGYKFDINDIVVLNDEEFNDSPARQKVIDAYKNTKMGQYEIIKLISELTNFYVGKGYTTTTVTIQESSLKSGVLTLKVLWGKVDGVTVDGKEPNFRQSTRLFSAMPFASGKVLNMSDVDQGLDNLLRVSNSDKLIIVPSDKNGYSKIDLQNTDVHMFSGSLGTNNSGTEKDGWAQYSASLSANNLAGFNDVLNYYTSFNDLNNNNDNQKSWSLGYSVPLGYWAFDAQYYHSSYDKTIGGDFGGYGTDGTSDRMSLKVSRMLFRDAKGKTSAYAKIESSDSTNNVEGSQIDVSSKRFSNVTVGLTRVGTLFDGSLYADLSTTFGVPWFGAAWKNDPDLTGFDVDAVKYNGILSWSKSLYQLDRVGVEYELGSGFQYTDDILVSDDNMSIGDEYTVRGYKDSYMSVNSAAYISNTFKFPISIFKFGINQISPFVGYDLAVVKDNCSQDVSLCHAEYMTGAAIGLKFNAQHFNSALTYSRPITEPTSLRHTGMAEEAIYYNASFSF